MNLALHIELSELNLVLHMELSELSAAYGTK